MDYIKNLIVACVLFFSTNALCKTAEELKAKIAHNEKQIAIIDIDINQVVATIKKRKKRGKTTYDLIEKKSKMFEKKLRFQERQVALIKSHNKILNDNIKIKLEKIQALLKELDVQTPKN